MNLHREFFMRKEELQQQRKVPRIAGSIADEVPLIFLAKLCQRLPGERPVGNLAIVPGEPSLTNLFFEPADSDKSATSPACPTGADRIPEASTKDRDCPYENDLHRKGRSRTEGLSRI
jgi:hypothetical protein